VSRNTVFALTLLVLLELPGVSLVLAENISNLTVENAIDIALEKNKDILKAEEEVNKANFQIMEAASGAYPQINGQVDFQQTLKQQIFVISFPDSTGKLKKNRLKVGTNYNGTLGANLTQPLYVGGKVGTALKAAKIYKTLSSETMKAVKQNVITGVVQVFNGVLLAEEIRKISIESLEQAENHLKNVQNRYNVGRAIEYDLLRARVNVANLKPNMIEAENNIQIYLLKLKEIMGLETDTSLNITGSFSEPDTTLFALANKTVAFDNRPDLKASELNVDLYEKNILIAKGDFLPTLTAGTTFAYAGNFEQFKYEASDWNPYWFADVQLTFPIFSGFKNTAKYKQATIEHLKAKTDYRKLRISTEIQVDESVMNLRKALEKIESQRMNIEEADRAVRIAESLYENGKATQLEVLDAQLALAVAKNNMATALYEGKIAEIALKNSLGLIDINK